MKLTFLGANHEVTGSRTLIECGGLYGYVDFGMEQGRDAYINAPTPVKAPGIDFVLLTHAHIDHSGLVPLLYKNGFRGKIFATDVTTELCHIMLYDSAHIQTQEAEWRNRRGKRADGNIVEPVYTMEHAMGAMELFHPCEYGRMVDVAPGVRVRFCDIGHMLGSSSIEVWLTEGEVTKKVVFSGDVGNVGQPMLRDPAPVDSADYLIIESTYGNRLHGEERPDHAAELAKIIQRALDRGGNVVIPAFAVGRTQEMLYFLREIKERRLVKGHPHIPVYLDSPLANEATNIFKSCEAGIFDKEARALLESGINPLSFDGLVTTVSTDESRAINTDPTPKVIISASGMCDAGRIRHHLKHNLWRSECIVLFAGYQAAGTLGRIIQDGADSVKIFGEKIAVRAEIATMSGISGHADKKGLLSWIEGFREKPAHVFVNHGNDEQSAPFVETLVNERGLTADAPFSGAEYDLLSRTYLHYPEGVPVKPRTDERRFAVNPFFEQVKQSAKDFMSVMEKLEGAPNKDLRRLRQELDALAEKYRR